jgi:CHAT domain-containing protein/tetratricopeptide (TPR) repeat protein
MTIAIKDQVRSLSEKVATLQRSGDIDQARQLADQAYLLALDHLPEGDYFFAQSARNRAIMTFLAGDTDEAANIFRIAFNLYYATLEKIRSKRIRLQKSGKLRAARDVSYSELLVARVFAEIGGQLGLHRDIEVAESATVLASLRIETGELQKAEHAAAEAQQAAQRAGKDGESMSLSLLQLQGRIAREEGKLEESKRTYTMALDRAKVVGSRLDIAGCNNNLGFACKELGQINQAEAFFRKAVDLTIDTGDLETKKCHGSFLSNLADLYAEIGQLDRAVQLQREALKSDEDVSDRTDFTYALHRFNLGIYLNLQGRKEEAYDLLREASPILARDINPRSHKFARQYANTAKALLQAGHFMEAEVYSVFTIETIRNTLGENNPAFAEALHLLGWVYNRRGKYDQAEGALRRAEAINRRLLPPEHPQQEETLQNLFVALAARGKAYEAFNVLKEFHAIKSVKLDAALRIGTAADRLQFLATLQESMAATISFIVRHYPNDINAVRWLYDLVLRRRGLSAETQIGQRDSILAGQYPILRTALERLQALRSQIARMLLDRSYDIDLPEHKQQLDALQAEADDIENQLSREIPETALTQKLRKADAAAVASALPMDTLLVEYVQYDDFRFAVNEEKAERRWGESRYCAFALEAGQPDSLRLVPVGSASVIDERIHEFRLWLTGDHLGRRFRVAGTRGVFSDMLHSLSGLFTYRRTAKARVRSEALRNVILDPLLLPHPQPASNKLLIAPDGALSWLPFECLYDLDGPLIDRSAISYLTCGRDVLAFKTTAGVSPADPVVMADPDYELSDGTPSIESNSNRSYDLRTQISVFSQLKGTRAEGICVAGILGVEPKMGPQATERLIKNSASPRVLHIATHGFFFEASGMVADTGGAGRIRYSEDPMLRSGLALAGANTFLRGGPLPEDAEDGVLSSRDVSYLDLRGTRLVILSACETGLGDLRQGEGVFGLRRGFWLAGARAMIVSLWKVADGPTAEFMKILYKELATGVTPTNALSQARQAMRKKRPDPYYWAAFVFIGDPTIRVGLH